MLALEACIRARGVHKCTTLVCFWQIRQSAVISQTIRSTTPFVLRANLRWIVAVACSVLHVVSTVAKFFSCPDSSWLLQQSDVIELVTSQHCWREWIDVRHQCQRRWCLSVTSGKIRCSRCRCRHSHRVGAWSSFPASSTVGADQQTQGRDNRQQSDNTASTYKPPRHVDPAAAVVVGQRRTTPDDVDGRCWPGSTDQDL